MHIPRATQAALANKNVFGMNSFLALSSIQCLDNSTQFQGIIEVELLSLLQYFLKQILYTKLQKLLRRK